jgi:general secretion pathway protein D
VNMRLTSTVLLALCSVAGLDAVGLGPVELGAQAAPNPVVSPATSQQAAPPVDTPAPVPDPAPAPEPAPAKKRDAIKTGKPVQAGSLNAQRKAAKLYLKGVKLLEKQQPEAAWKLLQQAVALTPDNLTYVQAAELARQSTVTKLVQQASRERVNAAASATAPPEAATLLQQAQSIDPTNPLVTEHLNQMAEAATGTHTGATASNSIDLNQAVVGAQDTLADGGIKLLPSSATKSFHLRMSAKQTIEEVFRAYGIQASVHDSVKSTPVRLDLDDVTFIKATQILNMVTHTFFEPLDPHRVIVATDTRDNRMQFQRLEVETVYLPGLNDKEMTEVSNIARNVFDAQQAVIEPTAGTITLRASDTVLNAFNRTLQNLEDGKSELDLNVKVIQLSHVSMNETGTKFFQQTGVYNVFSEINSVLSQNQSAVQQIIASGLVPNASTLANQIEILAILVASGQLTGTPFNQGFLPFGGGLTQSILSPGPASLALSLNSSDTRVLDDIHLQLADQEEGTFKVGQRYPIETSSYSSVALPAVAGISSALAAAAAQTVPQIEYQDIGLTLKATPKVMRSNDVALAISLKITALGGAALNDIPILNNQENTGVVTVKAGETAVIVSDLSRTESQALSGLPGVSAIPGLQDVSDIARNQNIARLLILVTPTVTRNVKLAGRGPRLRIDRATPSSHSFN